jgi:hypothetical protein
LKIRDDALAGGEMTITYNDGSTREAMILARTARTMRVAMEASDDVIELNQINNIWVTDDCEPVQVAFAWEKPQPPAEVTEADCICSPELAARLLHLLHSDEESEERPPALTVTRPAAFALQIM